MTYSTILSNQIDQRFSVLPVISLDQARRRQAARLSTWELIPRARPDSDIIVWNVGKIKTVFDNISWIVVFDSTRLYHCFSAENSPVSGKKWEFSPGTALHSVNNRPKYMQIFVCLYNTENFCPRLGFFPLRIDNILHEKYNATALYSYIILWSFERLPPRGRSPML